MPWFSYRDGELHAEGVKLSEIAKAVGTPAYVYSTAALTDRYTALAEAFAGLPAPRLPRWRSTERLPLAFTA